MLFDGRFVGGSAVSLVLLPLVGGELAVVGDHHLVSEELRDDAGCRDLSVRQVCFRLYVLLASPPSYWVVSVYIEKPRNSPGELSQRSRIGQLQSSSDPHPVYLPRPGPSDTYVESGCADGEVQHLPLLLGDLLGVGHPRRKEIQVRSSEGGYCRDDGTSQGSETDFVDPSCDDGHLVFLHYSSYSRG